MRLSPIRLQDQQKKRWPLPEKPLLTAIGAQPEEIFFTSGGTESDNWAIKGTLQYGDGRAILTSQIEHHAILNACASVERLGYPVVYLSVDQKGVLTPATLNKFITGNTKLVSVMLVNNEIGTIEPIKELAEIAHIHGAFSYGCRAGRRAHPGKCKGLRH